MERERQFRGEAVAVEMLDEMPSVASSGGSITRSRHARRVAVPATARLLERALDVAVILLLLPVVVPMAALIALAIKLDSPGPVLYRASRIGRDGRPFAMFKFRKMRRDVAGSSLTLHADERFTPIGEFLAMTKLDELPQLLNVLRGEMRLVGPRPEVEEFVAAHPDAYDVIHTVTPGLTGPAQVQFASERHLLGAAEEPVTFYRDHLLPEKIAVDIDYARRRTLAGDVGILLRTAYVPIWRLLQARSRDVSRRHTLERLIALSVAGVLFLGFLWLSTQA